MARMGAAGRLPRSPAPATERPTARRPGHSRASHAPATALPEARRGGKGDPAHRAGGAMHVRRGARRRGAGCSPALPADFLRTQPWRKHRDDAAWGSHGPRPPLARRDAASPMWRRRRDALGHGRLEGTRTGRLIGGAVQEEGKVASVLTAGRRWSRCRLDVGGGAASASRFTVVPCSGPAPPRSRSPPSPSGSSLPRPASAATRRRRRASVSRLASSSPTSPLLLPPPAVRLREGAKPQCGLVAVVHWRLPSSRF
jgi:hypothetical protein